MLNTVKVYSSWRSAPILPLAEDGRPETDLVQILNIDGLDPVQASVSTSPYAAIDGADHKGSSVASRNIVLTVHPNPDWDLWTFENLRKLLYAYFMPKRSVQLVFYSDERVPVQIKGIVESVSVNPFSKDPEIIASIICPDPHFTAVDPVVLTGTSDGGEEIITYNGDIETGIKFRLNSSIAPDPTLIGLEIGDIAPTIFYVATSISPTVYFEMSSVAFQKYVQNVSDSDGLITNRLSYVQEGSEWPTLQPGDNEFLVVTNAGIQDWELTYYEKFGGL